MLRFTTVGSKQNGDNARWQYVWDHIGEIVPEHVARKLVDDTASEVEATISARRVGWAWSGGKDSQALAVVMQAVGVAPCVLGMTLELEYPDFLRWVTDYMPWELSIYDSGHTLGWLAEHQEWLFPQHSSVAAKWFAAIQHKAQASFVKEHDLDMIILGRRFADRNNCGDSATGVYTNASGVTHYSPIRHWTHEQVLAVCYWYKMPMAPFYGWVNGWVVGTGCWAARQWTGSTANGWRELWQIDPSIVLAAASCIESAAAFVKEQG